MFALENRVFIDISVDGKTLEGVDLFGNMAFSESVAGLFPAATIVLNDYSDRLVKDLSLTDGNEILVTVGKSSSDLRTISRQYRLFQLKRYETGFGPQLFAHCIYDAPNFTTKNCRQVYTGTSSEVLAAIAGECSLYYSGPESFNGRRPKDNQKWWNINRSRAAFSQYNVARHGMLDTNSAMCSALTSMGELRYRNLMDVIESPISSIKYAFVHNSLPGEIESKFRTYLVDEAQYKSDAGLMNTWQNYGSTRVVHDAKCRDKDESGVNVKCSGKYLAINEQVSQTVEKSARFDYSFLDCGNVHEKYERAFYQNIKQLALFSERVSILCREPTEVQLLDPVIYRQANTSESNIVSASDIYLVVAKTIFIKGGAYYSERLELVRMSLTEKGSSALKSEVITPGNSIDLAIPESIIDPTANNLVRTSLAAANSIRQILSSAESVARAAVNSSLSVPSSIQNLVFNLQSLQQTLTPGFNPNSVAQLLGNSSTAISAYIATTQLFNSTLSQSSTAIRNTLQSMLGNPMSTIIRQAPLFLPNGILASTANILGPVLVYSKVCDFYNISNNFVRNSANRALIQSVPGGIQSLADFNQSVLALNQANRAQISSIATIWNSGLSHVLAQPIPVGADPSNIHHLENLIRGSLDQPIKYEAKVKSPNDVLQDLKDAIFSENANRTARWLDSNSIKNITFQPSLDNYASDIENMSKACRAQLSLVYV